MFQVNRRSFFRWTAAVAGLSMAGIWQQMVRRQWKSGRQKEVFLPLSLQPVTFYGNYIVVNRKGKIKVFSSHCTHLGCRIHKVEHGKLICPCHGSVFDLEGYPVKGPAYKPLVSFPFREAEGGKRLVIQNSAV